MVARRRGLRPTAVRVRGTRRRALRTRCPSAPPERSSLFSTARTRCERSSRSSARRQRHRSRRPSRCSTSNGLLVDGPAAEEHDAAACYVALVSSATPAQPRNRVDELVRRGLRVGARRSRGGAPARDRWSHDGVRGPLWTDPASDGDLIVAAPAAQETCTARKSERTITCATPHHGSRCSPPTAASPRWVRSTSPVRRRVTPATSCDAGRPPATSTTSQLIERQPVRAPMPAATSTITAGLAALICLRWLGARDPTLPGVLYALELQGTLALTRHRVLRVPRCPACGTASPPANPWFREIDAGAARQPGDAGR